MLGAVAQNPSCILTSKSTVTIEGHGYVELHNTTKLHQLPHGINQFTKNNTRPKIYC